ncbi:hypothetical protein Agub_g13892, partial [Astrephomene gubernaculifera]
PLVLYGGHSGWVTSMALLPPATNTAAAAPYGGGMTMSSSSIVSGNSYRLLQGYQTTWEPSALPAPALATSYEPSLVTASTDWTVRLWNAADAAGNSGDGDDGAAGGDGAAATVTGVAGATAVEVGEATLRCNRPRAVMIGHGSAVTALCVDKAADHGAAIISGAQDGSVCIWSADGRRRQLLPGHGGA